MGIIYCYTNKVTGKKYIGQTIHPEQRKRNHLHEATKRNSDYYFHRSIRKHGWENFDYEVLEEAEEGTLSDRETHHIRTLNTRWPNGYNQLEYHNEMPPEIRNKISAARKREWYDLSEEDKQKKKEFLLSLATGRKNSDETKRKMSESAKNYIAKNPRPKRIWTQEMRDKQSAILKDKYKNGIGRWAKPK